MIRFNSQTVRCYLVILLLLCLNTACKKDIALQYSDVFANVNFESYKLKSTLDAQWAEEIIVKVYMYNKLLASELETIYNNIPSNGMKQKFHLLETMLPVIRELESGRQLNIDDLNSILHLVKS